MQRHPRGRIPDERGVAVLTYSYTFSKSTPGARHGIAFITCDSGKPNREDALADLRQYVTEHHGAMHAPISLSELKPEHIVEVRG